MTMSLDIEARPLDHTGRWQISLTWPLAESA